MITVRSECFELQTPLHFKCVILFTHGVERVEIVRLKAARPHIEKRLAILTGVGGYVLYSRRLRPARSPSRTRAMRAEKISSTTLSALPKPSTTPCVRGELLPSRRPCCRSRILWHSGRSTTLTWRNTQHRCQLVCAWHCGKIYLTYRHELLDSMSTRSTCICTRSSRTNWGLASICSHR